VARLSVLNRGIDVRGLFPTLLLLAVPLAGAIELRWNPSLSSNVTRYWVNHGTHSGHYFERQSSSTTNLSIPALQSGFTHYFMVTAEDADGLESPPSNEVFLALPDCDPCSTDPGWGEIWPDTQEPHPFTIPPLPGQPSLLNIEASETPGGLSLDISGTPQFTHHLEFSTNLTSWTVLMSFSNASGHHQTLDWASRDLPMGFYRVRSEPEPAVEPESEPESICLDDDSGGCPP